MATVSTIHLEIPEIPGESEVEGYMDPPQIDCKSWSWGASATTNMQVATGGTATGANVQDIRVTKSMDGSSANLMWFCSKGTQMPKITLHLCKGGGADGTQWDWCTIVMENCIIAGVTMGGSGDDPGQETVTINFSKYNMKYFKQADDDGVQKAGADNTYDIRAGKQV